MKAILQARMKSSRLPGKVLLEAAGRPLISHNIQRIRAARLIDEVIVATTTNPEDDALEKLCRTENVPVFRGSEQDVLDRTYQCAKKYNLPEFAKFTADNPLIDPQVIDHVIQYYLDNARSYDYVSNNHPPTWQDGQEVEIIRLAALEEAWKKSDQPFQREHVTPYIWDQPQRFRLGNVARSDDEWYHRYRWTLDYPADYEFMKRVYGELFPGRKIFSTSDIMNLLLEHPEIERINSQHKGTVWYENHLKDLKTIKNTPPQNPRRKEVP